MRSLLGLGAVLAAAVVAAPVMANAAYLPTGPQLNVSVSTVTNGGWSQCFSGGMDQFLGNSASSALSACNGDRILVAGRATGSDTFLVLAQTTRADAFFDTGAADNGVTHESDGTAWYNSDNWSFGFAPAGEQVRKYECDTNSGQGRLCLHTINNAGGYRFNDITTFSSDYEKVVYTMNGTGVSAAPEPGSWALMIVGFGLGGLALRRRSAAAAA